MFTPELIQRLRANADKFGITPANCFHCEYDRKFPGFEAGGWIQQENNGPIVPCPVCNPDQRVSRS